MTLFEYLAIAFSLVLSFAAMRLIGGLPHAFAAGRRYWVHATLVSGQLFGTAVVFWALWSFRDVAWTFPRFVLTLASPALVYFGSCTLIPEAPGAVASWRDHYYAVRSRYYGALCAWVVCVSAAGTLLLSMPTTHPVRAFHLAGLAVGALGLGSASPRVHAGIAASMLGLMVAAASLVIARPGALAH